jgi:formate dehydrogenase subunit gamma
MPPETAAEPWAPAVQQALAAHKTRPGPLLPILHDIQRTVGYVPAEAVTLIADSLNLSRAEVHGVVTFYHDFREAPAGRHVLKLCLAESCQAVGCNALLAHAKAVLGVEMHGTTADGALTLEPVYCLGNCALSPALMVDGEIVGRVSPARFDALVAQLREAP